MGRRPLELTVGEKYSVRNMVYALLLTGANDVAKAIAEHVGGGETGFVQLMNEYAAKIGGPIPASLMSPDYMMRDTPPPRI